MYDSIEASWALIKISRSYTIGQPSQTSISDQEGEESSDKLQIEVAGEGLTRRKKL
jgi:hypothetical protein